MHNLDWPARNAFDLHAAPNPTVHQGRRPWSVAVATGAIGFSVACGSTEPRTDAERLARGREIVERMSAKLGTTKAFSVWTTEVRDEVTSTGAPKHVTVTRNTTVRRPDRLYSAVSGDRRTEIWYDGVGVAVAMHDDKIFGQIRAPETLD